MQPDPCGTRAKSKTHPGTGCANIQASPPAAERFSVLPLALRPARSSLPSVPVRCRDLNGSKFSKKVVGVKNYFKLSGVPKSSLRFSPGLKPGDMNGRIARASTPATWIKALKTLSGGGKKQVEHLAFGDCLSRRGTVAVFQDMATESLASPSTTSVRGDGCLPTDVTASSFPSTAGREV